jgi:hypothetical protein
MNRRNDAARAAVDAMVTAVAALEALERACADDRRATLLLVGGRKFLSDIEVYEEQLRVEARTEEQAHGR